MAVNTKKYKMLPWKGKKYSSIPEKYITSKVVLLHAGCVARQFLTQEYPWKTVKFTGWRYQDIKMKQSCSFFSRFLKPDTGDTQRNPPTHPPCWQGGTRSLRAGSHATTPKLGPRKCWEPGSKRTIRFPDSLPKKARDRPQEVCERLLMFTHVFSQHRACIYRAAIWLRLPCSWLQSSRSAVRGHLNAECLVHG